MGAVFRQERGIVQQAVAQLACHPFYPRNIWQTLSAKLNSARNIRETLSPKTGILLCTRKNHELVEYALAGMSNNLFVSRYQVQLPGKEEMAAFLHKAVEELGGGDE